MNDHDGRYDHRGVEAHGFRGGTDEEAQLLSSSSSLEEFEIEDGIAGSSAPPVFTWAVLEWLSGPRPPRIQQIIPFLPDFQAAPVSALDRVVPKARQTFVLMAFIIIWIISFITPLRAVLPIQDGKGEDVVNLDCVDTLWHPKNECGLDGVDCGPFTNSSFAFRCPANCLQVKVLNPHAVGSLDVNYRPFVIGSDPVYRGDSFICGAAIHAGIVDNALGGCGRVSREGRHADFASTTANGIESIPFDSYFPLSFSLASEPDVACPHDPRSLMLVISALFTSIFSVFATAPSQFFVLFIAIFAHVSIVSDPPIAAFHSTSVLPDHVSKFAERLLPALFCAVVVYRTSVRRVLDGLRAQYEKTILWLGGFWFGALSNYTLDWIPIQRLTGRDLGQPGAKVALAVIIIILVCILSQQVYYLRLEGRLLRFLGLYGLFLAAILVGIWIPGLELRIHHYILALLLLPGTSMQTRPSLLYQGILLGLFVNGAARWGLASVLQTPDSLRQDGGFGSLLPSVLDPAFSTGESDSVISLSWAAPSQLLDGISVLVNDVERYRHFFTNEGTGNFTWARPSSLDLPEYYRFAFIKDGVTLDYTGAGTWFPNGSWSMLPNQ